MASIDNTGLPVTTPPVPTLAPVPVPTAQTVYSAPNITQAATAPVKAVNPVLEEYNQYMNSPEITAAKAKLTATQQAINAEKAGLRSTTTGLEYQNDQALGTTGASVNLIGRQVGRASELSSNRQNALADTYNADLAYVQGLEKTATDQYNIISQEKDKIRSLIAQTGNKAGISPTDSFEVATEKAYNWQKKQDKKAKEETKKQAEEAEKKQLKSLIASVGGSTKNKKGGSLSTKELKAQYEKLTGDKYRKEESRSDQEWAMKVKQFNKSMSGGSTTKLDSLLEKAASMGSGGREWAESVAKQYGVDPAQIKAVTKQDGWEAAYGSSKTNAAMSTADLNKSINLKISQISDWESASTEDKKALIRSMGGDPKDYGVE